MEGGDVIVRYRSLFRLERPRQPVQYISYKLQLHVLNLFFYLSEVQRGLGVGGGGNCHCQVYDSISPSTSKVKHLYISTTVTRS